MFDEIESSVIVKKGESFCENTWMVRRTLTKGL